MSAASKTKTYDVVSTDVRRMTKLHTPAGDIKFTSLMKLIYAYIWTFQENKERGNDDPIHTNTNVIAWEMGVSEKAVIDALKALDAAGVVIKHTIKVRGNVNSSNYVAIPPASVVALGITPPKPGNGKVSNPASKKTEEKQGEQEDGKSDEQAKQAEPTNQPTDTPADQNVDLASEPAPASAGQQFGVSESVGNNGNAVSATDSVNISNSKPLRTEIASLEDLTYWRNAGPSGFGFMEYGGEFGETDVGRIAALIDLHYFNAMNQITIIDGNGVVTEAFINSLTGDVAPNRNDDGTLHSFQYVYWVARHTQDERDGVTVRTREEYMAEAMPWHIPPHLLSTPTPEPEYDEDLNF